MRNYKFFIYILFIFIILPIYPLENISEGYNGIMLGMKKDVVNKLLENSKEFNLKKEEILNMRLQPDTDIISTEGLSFINYAYFHFYKDELYQIFFLLSEEKIGYYHLLKRLTERFGQPITFSPKKASWSNNKVQIIIEKPCSIKYILVPVWNGLITKDQTSDTVLEKQREKFIDGL